MNDQLAPRTRADGLTGMSATRIFRDFETSSETISLAVILRTMFKERSTDALQRGVSPA